jgi:hypothetical protein
MKTKMKVLKDALVTSLVVGSFLGATVGLAAELRRPWPQAETVAQQQQAPDTAEPAAPRAGTYLITACAPCP